MRRRVRLGHLFHLFAAMHAGADAARLLQRLLLLLGRCLRIERAGERQEHLAQRHRGADLAADLALALQGHDRESAWHLHRIADRADRHFGNQTRHLGIELILLHPAQRATLQRRLVLAELRGDHRERGAGTQLADHRLGESLRVRGSGRIFNGNEDLANAILRLANLLRQHTLLLGHLRIGDLHLIAKLLANHLGPAELRAQLIDQGPLADTTRVEPLSQRTCRQAVARLDIADRVGDRLVGNHDTATQHLLHAQLLIDELAGDLMLEPIQHVRLHRQAGGQCEQPGTVVDIGIADHVAIHHGHDPRRLRRRRRRSRHSERCDRLREQ